MLCVGVRGSQAERKTPTTADTYLQQTFYPDVADPVLLEIRRERAIELVAEGMRFNDLRRWKCGELIEQLPWTGMHITALNTDIDLNGDGTPDCYFTDNGTQSSNKDCKTVNVKNETGLYVTTAPAGGYDLQYIPVRETASGIVTTVNISILSRHK